MENSVLKVMIDSEGGIRSLYHKESSRECIEEGQVGNRLVLYDDMPFFWDAWYALSSLSNAYHCSCR